jgi:hypothetical protein
MRYLSIVAISLICAGCSPVWPKDKFPAQVEVKRTLFSAGGFGVTDTCEAIIVEMKDVLITRIGHVRMVGKTLDVLPPDGWSKTPVEPGGKRWKYEGALYGCSTDQGRPLGDLEGALKRPGSFYKILDNGDGIAIIAPSAKLAGFFYNG